MTVCNTVAEVTHVEMFGSDGWVRFWAGEAFFVLKFSNKAWDQLEHVVREHVDDERRCDAAPTVGNCCLPIGHTGGHAFVHQP